MKTKEQKAISRKAYYERNKERERAKALRYYYTHKEQASENNRRWRAEHREIRNEQHRQWLKDNPTAHKEMDRRYAELHQDKINEYHRKWYAKNLESQKEKHRIRKVAYRKTSKGNTVTRTVKQNRRKAKGHTTSMQMQNRWDYYFGLCWICSDDATQVDHVFPLSKGGTNWPANLRPICKNCNQRKGHKKFTPPQIMQIAKQKTLNPS